jgi:hypothetical protein
MSDNSDRIDLSKLGFEITFPEIEESSSISRRYCRQEEQAENLASAQNAPSRLHGNDDIVYNIDLADELSCVSLDSYYDDGGDDDDDIRFAPRPTKSMPRRTDYRREQLTNDDLGYEPADQQPSQADLGYGDESNIAPLGHEDGEAPAAATSSIRLLKVGYPVRNRRSMGLAAGRRFTNDSRLSGRFSRRRSTCSGSTASSNTSGKMRSVHSKSRTLSSQRERLVTRSASRRLNRQHPAQPTLASHDAKAGAYQTLEDLGCAELFLHPHCRMPRRISLEYGNDCQGSVASCRQPTTVCLEFDNSSVSNAGLPRRVSIKYDQRRHADDDQSGRVLRRRGSLDFSVGTSCLPRRASLGKSSVHSQVQHQSQQEAQHSSRRRASCRGGYEVNHSAQKSRRGSLGNCTPPRQSSDKSSNTRISRRSSIAHIPRSQIKSTAVSEVGPKAIGGCEANYSSSISRRGSLGNCIPPRQSSDNSLYTRLSHRLSLSHIPRSQMKNTTVPEAGPMATAIKTGRRRLSLKHVGAVEYLTRDTLFGRSA